MDINCNGLYDCCVLSLYFLNICCIKQFKIDCNFLQDRTICRLYSVLCVQDFPKAAWLFQTLYEMFK